MPKKFDTFNEIDDQKETWRLAVRLTDLWTVKYQSKPSHFEGIFMDAKGDKIQVRTFTSDIDYWRELLKENLTYCVTNVGVKHNDLDYKACGHTWRLELTKGTSLRQQDFPEIPHNTYKIADFDEILSGKVSASQLVDVIGIYPVSISNSLFGSKLHINENIGAIQDFSNSLMSCQNSESQSQGSSQFSSYSPVGLSEQDKFKYNAKLISIADTNGLRQDKTFVTIGTIKKFITGNGWFYEGCFRCYKRRPPPNETSEQAYQPWTCSCGIQHDKPSLRYKLQFEVQYKEHKTKFVIWDTEASKIIGKEAVELRQQLQQEGEDDPKIFPEALDGILGQTFALRFKAQLKYNYHSVTMLVGDKDFIQSLEKIIELNEEDKTAVNEGNCVIPNEKLLPVDIANQVVFGSANHDPEDVEPITPAKRMGVKNQREDMSTTNAVTAQLSSTRIRKRIKKE